MSSPVMPIDNLSASFFYQYDSLERDADSLLRSEADLSEAEAALQKVRNDFTNITKEMEWNRSYYKEQVDRIQLVLTHWFYGTTALQPQLWLRGGCAGKIERARHKMQKTEQEYPPLAKVLAYLKNQHISPLEATVKVRRTVWERCVSAVSKRLCMKDEAVRQNPSPRLGVLREDNSILMKQLNTLKRQMEHVDGAKVCQVAAVSHHLNVVRCLGDVELLQRRYVSQSRELQELTIKCPNDLSMSLARPCAAEKCGYAVSSWHPTHCCNACQHGKTFPHDHGEQCGRKARDYGQSQSEQRLEHISERELLQRDMERVNIKCKEKWSESRELANRAANQMRQASAILRMLTNECVEDGLLGSFVPANISSTFVSLGCAYIHTRESKMRQALEHVHHELLVTKGLGKQICDLEQKLRVERDYLEQRQNDTSNDISAENTKIFSELRSQVMIIEPSAPPGPW